MPNSSEHSGIAKHFNSPTSVVCDLMWLFLCRDRQEKRAVARQQESEAENKVREFNNLISKLDDRCKTVSSYESSGKADALQKVRQAMQRNADKISEETANLKVLSFSDKKHFHYNPIGIKRCWYPNRYYQIRYDVAFTFNREGEQKKFSRSKVLVLRFLSLKTCWHTLLPI